MLLNVKGKISPKGWILEHLNRDKDGITGNLDKLCEDAACGIFEDKKVKDHYKEYWSSWWPGETEGNWRDAFTKLAFALDDPELIKKTKDYVESILRYQEEDGYIGIYVKNERFGNGPRSGELWTQSRIMLCLLTYYENTKEERVMKALEKLTDLVVKQFGPLAGGRSLYQVPDEDGSKAHSLMIIEPILAVYDVFPKQEYIAFCEFLFDDYSRHAIHAKYPCYDISSFMATNPYEHFVGHGPHTCEQLRIPFLLYAKTGKREYYNVFAAALDKLKKYMSLSGSCKSDEMIGAFQKYIPEKDRKGMNLGECFPIPAIGYEYCSTTELMMSFMAAFLETKDMGYADMEEWLVMNAAMAARRQDGKAILYLCADNLYEATKAVGDRWDYSPTHADAAVCCAPNSCKVMPYHSSKMWLTDENGELYAPFYGPCTLKTVVKGVPVTIEEDTIYPFENKIVFKIYCDRSITTTLHLRIPSWSDSYSVVLNGAMLDSEATGTGFGKCTAINREWNDGDQLEIVFHCRPEIVQAVDGTKAVRYGPLLYALDIAAVGEDYHTYNLASFCDTNYTPAAGADWEYTLLLDQEKPARYIEIQHDAAQGFEWENTPVALQAMMLSRWALPEKKTLVPIGCTTLRRTTFTAVTTKGCQI